MRLLQINSVYKQGSTGRICFQISEEFKKQDIGESRIIYFGGRKSDSKDAIRCASWAYLKMVALLSRVTGKYGFVAKRATKKAIEEIERFNPDVIHLHNIHDHSIDLEMLFGYLKNRNVKLLWTFHDCWAYTGYCAHYTMNKCDKWKKNCNDCVVAHKYSWFFDRAEELQRNKKNIYGDISFEIITPSKWLANEVQKSFLGGCNVSVINNGIDLSMFYPRVSEFKEKNGITEKHMILGVAFKWDAKKGIDVFFDLAKRLRSDYIIVLVGSITKKRDGLTNIVYIDRTSSQEELAEIYSSADVFVNPTREEVFGLVNIESLACGTPVITFNSGGSPECIDEMCGRVVEAEQVDELYDAIIDICENKPFSIEACQKRASQFDANNIFKQYVAKYIEIV